jgi:hypothetical protein
MLGTFALSAIPHLEYVTFIATDGDQQHRWIRPNVETLVQDLALVVDAATAQSMFRRLSSGESVLFHGLF